MMGSPAELWNGIGDAEGKAWWTKNNGEIVGVRYVRGRAVNALGEWTRVGSSTFTAEVKNRVLAETVDNLEWMRQRHGQTVGSVCREVTDHMLGTL
jgi:hypothetical protein